MSETSGHNNGNGHKPRRRYSDKERASVLAVLASNAGNVLRTARDTGVPRKTVELWAKDEVSGNLLPGVAAECQGKKEELSAIFERVARVYLKHAESADVVADTKGKDAVIAAATATDKQQLLEGKPTSISGTEKEVKAKKLIADYKAEFPKADDAEAIEFLAPEFPEVRELGKIG